MRVNTADEPELKDGVTSFAPSASVDVLGEGRSPVILSLKDENRPSQVGRRHWTPAFAGDV